MRELRTTATDLDTMRVLLRALGLTVLMIFSLNALGQSDETAPPVEILSENGRLDVPTGAYVLTGNVRIFRGTLSVFADEARSFSGESGELERVELYGTPTRWNDTLEDGSEVDGVSDEILYDFITNLITMRGNAEIQNVQGQFSGDQLVYDLDTQNLVGDGNVRLLIEPATAQSATDQISGSEDDAGDDEQPEVNDDDAEG
ncbi:MAG: lipopolysaccharide transport periplasmic protein LptA [Pseudomonadota bacterium]